MINFIAIAFLLGHFFDAWAFWLYFAAHLSVWPLVLAVSK